MKDDCKKTVILANWKMNKNLKDSVDSVNLLRQKYTSSKYKITLNDGLESLSDLEKIVLPSFTCLFPLHHLLFDSSIKLGAQNVHDKKEGAYTGEVSVNMLEELCDYVMIGHSERRINFGETEELINRKLLNILGTDLIPVLCLGEKDRILDWHDRKLLLKEQIKLIFNGISSLNNSILIIYEPMWAIGTGYSLIGQEASDMIKFIREELTCIYFADVNKYVKILAGGSIKPDNVEDLMKYQDIDGVGVGHASLNSNTFLEIAIRVSHAKKII